jgi:RNA polymerase primary sigma factor
MLKRLMTIGLLALASLPAQAEIFKCTDAAGHVMYSNVASKGCTKMNLEPISTIPAASKAAPKAEKAEKPAKPAAKAAAKSSAKAAAPADDDKPKRGRKPKAAAENKKGAAAKVEDEEEDFSDIDAELEAGGDEVAEEPTAEVAEVEKAKPLRMKVSRAKERALMREFGLEETTLTEEEAAKRRHELKTLIKMGKTRGFLTHQEINDHLPEKLVNEEILEAIVSMLNDMGIAVYEQAPDAATLLIQGNTTAITTQLQPTTASSPSRPSL